MTKQNDPGQSTEGGTPKPGEAGPASGTPPVVFDLSKVTTEAEVPAEGQWENRAKGFQKLHDEDKPLIANLTTQLADAKVQITNLTEQTKNQPTVAPEIVQVLSQLGSLSGDVDSIVTQNRMGLIQQYIDNEDEKGALEISKAEEARILAKHGLTIDSPGLESVKVETNPTLRLVRLNTITSVLRSQATVTNPFVQANPVQQPGVTQPPVTAPGGNGSGTPLTQEQITEVYERARKELLAELNKQETHGPAAGGSTTAGMSSKQKIEEGLKQAQNK